ncbi:MAG: DUF3570 domain-containing protein [Bacteroidia bacterium]
MTFIFFVNEVKAQVKNSTSKGKSDLTNNDSTKIVTKVIENNDWKTIDVNFLNSYYQQDGNNSPVTGGIGTEQLTDFTQKIIVSAPLTKKTTLKVDGGYDYYSSASTDNIDNIPSSDSASDVRVHGNVGLSIKKSKQHTFGFRIGGSTEYDYNSAQFGSNYSFLSKNKNTGISVAAQAFLDQWSPIYPIELRRTSEVPTSARQSYSASLGLTQIVTKKMKISLIAEAVSMNGLLSTPFHRVYFSDQESPKIENLPNSRFKVPVALRMNYYISNRFIARTYIRHYWDNWGVRGNTASIEIPFKINRFLAVYPHYRFHSQTAAEHFSEYKQHQSTSEFYTSDFDLSALTSQHYGIGLTYSPLQGIAKFGRFNKDQKHMVTLKSLDLKYSHYQRSTNFNADIISFGLGFEINRGANQVKT